MSIYLWCLLYHVSCIIYPVSCIPYHVSCLTSPVSRLLSPVSCLTSPVSSLTSPVSHLLSHLSFVSRLLSYVFCLTSPVSCPTSPVTCPTFHVLLVVSFLYTCGAVGRYAWSDAGGQGFNPWMVFIFPQLSPERLLQMTKTPKVNHNNKSKKFRNLSQSLRNTQALTTGNIRLLNSVTGCPLSCLLCGHKTSYRI